MYTPEHYKNEDLGEIKSFIRENGFGLLISTVNGSPWATHIPLVLEVDKNGNDCLVGHIAKANPQWKYFKKQSEVLCIFSGPHAYISSSWYKEEEVPTWNYLAVHVYGQLTILTEEEVMASLHRLVDKYEAVSEHPVRLDNLSQKTLRQVKGVVGFSIEIERIQATYKLSQTRPEDHAAIITELEKTHDQGSQKIALRMRKNL